MVFIKEQRNIFEVNLVYKQRTSYSVPLAVGPIINSTRENKKKFYASKTLASSLRHTRISHKCLVSHVIIYLEMILFF